MPEAFKIAATNPPQNQAERRVRLACRDVFRQSKLLGKIIPLIEEVLAAGEIEPPAPAPEAVAPAIDDGKPLGDVGHRH